MSSERSNTRSFAAGVLAAACLAFAGAALTAQPAAAQPAAPQAEQAGAQDIVVHLGSFTNDLHASFMALSLATNLQQSGAQVTLFLDREGVRMADSRQRGDLTWGDTGGIADEMDAFTGAGGRIVLCPHCAHLGGVDAASLRPGASIATPEEVAALFLAADKVIDF